MGRRLPGFRYQGAPKSLGCLGVLGLVRVVDFDAIDPVDAQAAPEGSIFEDLVPVLIECRNAAGQHVQVHSLRVAGA